MKKKFVILISTLTFICVCAISVFAVDYYKDDVDADKWAHSFAVTWRKSMEVTDFSNNCEYFDLLSDFLISEAKNAYSDTVDNVKQSDNQDNTSILVYPKKSPDKSVTSLSYNYGGIKLTIELPENIKACY